MTKGTQPGTAGQQGAGPLAAIAVYEVRRCLEQGQLQKNRAR